VATLRNRQLATPALALGDSELGGMAVAVAAGEVVGVSFGNRSAAAAGVALARRMNSFAPEVAKPAAGESIERDQALADEVLKLLQQYAAGVAVDCAGVPLSVSHLTPFQRRVVKVCRAIKRGQSLSYGEVAARAGSPGAARAVGQVMRTNRTPLLVPCHRVVAASGKIGGFSAPQGLTMKRRLLELESDRLLS
jgi:methylated-DNA-[protein]-cysteine S-methyltransferase